LRQDGRRVKWEENSGEHAWRIKTKNNIHTPCKLNRRGGDSWEITLGEHVVVPVLNLYIFMF